MRRKLPRYLLISGFSVAATVLALVVSAALSTDGPFASSLLASPTITMAQSPESRLASTRQSSDHAGSAVGHDRPQPRERSLVGRYTNLVGEFRFDPGTKNRSWSFLSSKIVVLGVLVFGVIALRRRCEPWWAMLCVASVLLAFNVFLDVGAVALTYNEPGLFGRSSTAPLFAYFEPTFAWPVLGHVAFIACLLALALPWLLSPACRPATFGAVVFVAAVVGPASLGFSAPPRQVLHQFFFSGLDYIQHTGALSGTPTMLREYVDSMPNLSIHASVHGPGPILTLSLFRAIAGDSVFLLSTMLQVVAALLPLLTWLTARRFLEDGAARLAAWLLLLTPSFHQFSFISIEGVIAVPLFGTAGLLICSLLGNRSAPGLALLFGSMVYVSALYSFSSAYLVPFALFTTGLALYWGLVPWLRTGVAALCSVGAFVVVYLLMRNAGFDMLACFRQASEINTAMMGSAWRSVSHYFFSVTGTLGAFTIGCGIPVTAMWLAAVRRYRRERSIASCVTWSASATVLLLALLGLYQWETERIWLFLVPLACLPAARYLHHIGRHAPRRVVAVLMALWLQTLSSELLLNTYW